MRCDAQAPTLLDSSRSIAFPKTLDKAALVGKVCVTELITHMVDSTREALGGSEDFHIYHDALSQLFARSTRVWMAERNLERFFIRPEGGLMHGVTELKWWKHQPPGNSPELMPLDSSLNKDLHDAVRRNIGATAHLEDGDPRKFSMASPVEGLDACLRSWELAPTPKRTFWRTLMVSLNACTGSWRSAVL